MWESAWRPLTRVFMESFLLGAFCVWGLNVCETDPCSDDNAIFLPQVAQCLVPINNAKSWVHAQATCEVSGGSLYRLPTGGGRGGGGRAVWPDPTVQSCLGAMGQKVQIAQDFWIGSTSVWSKQWMWVNGSLLNPIRYVTTDVSAFSPGPVTYDLCSRYLSVDYCVSVCHDTSDAYTVLHWRKSYPCCRCASTLDKQRVSVSRDRRFNPDRLSYYIADSRQGQGHLIRLEGSETYSKTETMCATVDTDTYSRRELRTQTCFSLSPFLCSLGTDPSIPCHTTQCQGTQCIFRVRDECVQRDSRPMTWYHARWECQTLGGDLWTVRKLTDMALVSPHLRTDTVYWVGATDHDRSFNPDSHVFGLEDPDYEVVRCGHMFLERSRVSAHAPQWKWADSRCDQHKAYICQYKQTKYTSSDTDQTVICPWTIPGAVTPTVVTGASGSTGLQTSYDPTRISTAVTSGNTSPSSAEMTRPDESSLPIVAIVAACVAALMILLCGIFVLGFSRRRKWMLKKWRRARSRMWLPWLMVRPTYLAGDHSSQQGLDSASSCFPPAHSDSGSVLVPGTPGIPYPPFFPGSTLKNQAHAHKSGSKEGGGRRTDALDQLRERLQGRVGDLDSQQDRGRAGNAEGSEFPTLRSIAEEHLLSTSYTSVASGTARDYVTLQAQMNIRDDEAESPNQTMRLKPEVALVTGDVDLLLTVNHAYSKNQAQGERFCTERGVEDGDLPLTPTLQIPTRPVEGSTFLL